MRARRLPLWYQPTYRPQGRPEARLPFTLEVQDDIWKHQNPPSCEGQRFLRVHWKSGLGSMIHVATASLAYAMREGYILVYDDSFGSHVSHGSFCHVHNLDCFFVPPSNCSSYAANQLAMQADVEGAREAVPQKWLDRWQATGLTGDIVYWWRAQASSPLPPAVI
jgi:hypothetical protein